MRNTLQHVKMLQSPGCSSTVTLSGSLNVLRFCWIDSAHPSHNKCLSNPNNSGPVAWRGINSFEANFLIFISSLSRAALASHAFLVWIHQWLNSDWESVFPTGLHKEFPGMTVYSRAQHTNFSLPEVLKESASRYFSFPAYSFRILFPFLKLFASNPYQKS